MPLSDRDIYTAALTLVKRYGEDATIHAAMRGDELLKEGDLEGERIWLRILAAIKELQRKERRDGESVN